MDGPFHSQVPEDLDGALRLPGVRPLADADWLRVDPAYAGQMALRRRLLAERRADVLWQAPEAGPAVAELFAQVLSRLPALGFSVGDECITCPDGARVDIRSDDPLAVLGACVQEDLCLMQKHGDEHLLTAAVLCFPANWTLAEKAGKPLSRIHRPVAAYDADITRRVQRLFDGVQVGRPLWRNNRLRYVDPQLYQPALEGDAQRPKPTAETARFVRAERQCILRLPETRAVVFSIHTYVSREAPAQ